MSSPRKRILSLNLGSQSIELAEFRALPDGGLVLLVGLDRAHAVGERFGQERHGD